MGTGRTDEFRKDAVRIALSSKDQKMIWAGLLNKSEQHRNVPNILFYLVVKSTSCVTAYIIRRFVDFFNSPWAIIFPEDGRALAVKPCSWFCLLLLHRLSK